MKNKKYHYLYKVTHKKTGRFYIGIHSTNNIDDRYFANGVYVAKDRTKSDWVKTNHSYNMKNSRFYNAMMHYGVDAFDRIILEFFDTRNDVLKKEREIVTEEIINTNDNFNSRVGGMGGIHSKEARDKISKNNPMKRKEVREKVRKAQLKRWTKKMKDELSETNPMYIDEIYKKNLGEKSAWFGKKHTEETKEKISKTKKGKKLTDEQKIRNQISLKKVGAKKFEILDTSTDKKFNSLNNLKEFLIETENKSICISTLSEIINKKQNRMHHDLINRFIYTKNSYKDRNPAKLYKRGKYWHMRIWDSTLKKQFKKSLGTQIKNEALKIMKIEENKFYNGILN